MNAETVKYEYVSRVNRAIDFIRNNYAADLDLEKVAQVTCFSKYHFHRIFRSQTGETPNNHIRRIRLEKALQNLEISRNKSITEIALDSGFSSSQNFAKAFKKHFGISPQIVRKEYNWYRIRDNADTIRILSDKNSHSRISYISDDDFERFDSLVKKISAEKKAINARIVQMPPFHLAYIRTIGTNPATFAKTLKTLIQWGNAREVIDERTICMGVAWSDSTITPKDKFIMDACITVPKDIKGDERISVQDVPGGKYAVCHCEMPVSDIQEMWLRLFIEWLRPSGYKPDRRPAYEIYYNDHESHPLKHLTADLCLAIKPL